MTEPRAACGAKRRQIFFFFWFYLVLFSLIFLVVCPLRLVAFLIFLSYLYLMVLRARSRLLAGMAQPCQSAGQPPSSISPPNHGILPLPHSGNQPRSLLSPVYAVLHYEYHYILLHIKGHILNIYDSFFEHASVTGRANVKIFRNRLISHLEIRSKDPNLMYFAKCPQQMPDKIRADYT